MAIAEGAYGGDLGPVYWRFWSAAVLANVGDGIRAAAFPLLAASLTRDPVAVAAVTAAQTLPWLVTGVLAGALVDRRGARGLIVAADTARFLLLAGLVAAVATGRASVAVVVGCAFALGVGETVRDTAAQTAVPRLVPGALLERANGRLTAGEIVGNEFAGPAAGAALFAAGAALPFAVNGTALALAVALVLSLPLSLTRGAGDATAAGTTEAEATAGEATAVAPGVRAGLRWLRRHRMLRTLAAVVAAVAAADAAWFAVLVLFAGDALGLDAWGFGLLLATGAAGGLAGSLLAERLIGGHRHGTVLAWAVAVTTVAPVLLAFVPVLWTAIAVLVTTSGSFALLNVAAVSLRQRLVPDGLLGRVTAAARTLTLGAAAGGALAGGALAGVGGMAVPFLACGCVGALALWAWLGVRD